MFDEVKRGPGRPRKEDTPTPTSALMAALEAPAPVPALDDVKETVNSFLDKIAVAKSNGDESIETTPEIISHYNRNGLNGAQYFIYSGIKVYPLGKKAEIEKKENEQMGQKIHGVQEGVVLNT